MCLIAWNWQPDSPTPLLLLANRDEFYARPAQALQWWEDAPVLAGRDLQAGGTWLGVSRTGRLAALTNFRQPAAPQDGGPSRGGLASQFLTSDQDCQHYLQRLQESAHRYNPFNLLVFDGKSLMGLESRNARIVALQPGVGAVSNADFLTPWPKLSLLQSRLQAQLDRNDTATSQLVALLQDRTIAPDSALPRTGVPQALERVLSAAFIATPHYGTRACSVVSMGQTLVDFTEHSFDAQGPLSQVQHSFVREAMPESP